jgi:hypothetical protein
MLPSLPYKQLVISQSVVDAHNAKYGTTNEISVKLEVFKNYNVFLNFVKSCKATIWIDAMLDHNSTAETDFYMRAFLDGYTHIGLTIAACRPDALAVVNKILHMGRSSKVRLVKGFYNDCYGDWSTVSKRYRKIARMLIEHGGTHVLATHDTGFLWEMYTSYPMSNIRTAIFDFSGIELNELPPFTTSVYIACGNVCVAMWHTWRFIPWTRFTLQYFGMPVS